MEKYDPKTIEKEILEFWLEKGIPEIIVSFNPEESKKKFFLLDGPPYVNGVPHAGHVKTTTTKDIWSKFRQMQGFQSWWQPGFDCGGLPIENAVEKKLGIKSKQEITERIGLDKFIEECKQMAVGNKDVWLNTYKKMGAWRGWLEPYMTYHNSYLESGWWTVKQMYEKGLFFEGYKPGYWCPHCETVLTGYEVSDSYAELDDISIFFKCKLKGKSNESLLVWTTTPWTLPANVSVLVHPDEYYVKVEVMGEFFWIAEKRLELLSELEMGFTVKERVIGKDMEGWVYEPVLDVPIQHETTGEYFRKVIMSKPIMKKRVASKMLVKGDKEDSGDEFGHIVEMDTGTGMVHIAPGHGDVDNKIGKEYNLPELSPVDDQGRLTEGAGQFAGMYAKDADKHIIDYLEKNSLLLKAVKIRHSYPLCWRCKAPLLFRMSRQWFLDVEKIKGKMLEFNSKVKWLPGFAKERMDKVLSEAPDWAITRQRFWGIPAPVWKCEKCGEIKVIGSREELKKNAVDKVGEDLHKNSVDKIHIKCKCGENMSRIPDIMDVWFDSGISPWASVGYPHQNKNVFEAIWPMDMICESQDQVRGWFYALLFMATSTFDESPYESVSMTGWTLDEKGDKMSKSLGNVVYAEDALNDVGADILRYYYCWGMSPWETQNFSLKVARDLRRVLDVLWNTAMFIDMYEADPSLIDKKFNLSKFRKEDKYIISKINSVIKQFTNHLENFELNFAGRLLGDFTLNDFSRWYIKTIRNRMSPWYEEPDKEEAQFTLFYVLENVIKLLAPISPFISEKIYQKMFCNSDSNKPVSIHLSTWPEPNERLIDAELEKQMEIVKVMIESANSLRQEHKVKLKWPVSEVIVETSNEDIKKSVENLQEILCEMGNSKKFSVGKVSGASNEFEGGKLSLGDVLEDEAFIREFSRYTQIERKEKGLIVTDKIKLNVGSDPETVDIFRRHEEQLKINTGSEVIQFGNPDENITPNQIEIMGKKVWFGLKKL
ncbi:MAG: isoleucine--tRNA ligase [Candidatus Aenigmarchaeota archaeon]|nr:isoleucine--tRNA ligase [Candidatus Aenigmarchaeota archaeon]